MAPHNRIWGLSDLHNDTTTTTNSGFSDVAGESTTNGDSTASADPLASSYCQPLSAAAAAAAPPPIPPFNEYSKNDIKLFHIPNLNLDDVCAATLKRILDEFLPIIRRRGFNVLSISEMCCCGDGLDYEPSRRRAGRKLRKQSSNVWGYNTTRFFGRRKSKSHTIHLRLRDARSHQRLLPWEDVAGTMAHELSHCAHQNHSQAFYKLMEEILEEHATLQVQKNQMNFEPLNRNTIVRNSNNNNPATAAVAAAEAVPTSRGHRLGGNSRRNKSRLLDDFKQIQHGGGYRLGGGGSNSKESSQASLQQAVAQAALARAATTRRRLLKQTRRLMERAKEPCVIEILDDDDDDDDNADGGNSDSHEAQTEEEKLNQKPKAKRKMTNRERNEALSKITTAAATTSAVDATTAPKKPKTKELIDLTSCAIDSSSSSTGTNPPEPGRGAIADDEDVTIVDPLVSWVCGRCTFVNRPLALVCDACLSQRS